VLNKPGWEHLGEDVIGLGGCSEKVDLDASVEELSREKMRLEANGG